MIASEFNNEDDSLSDIFLGNPSFSLNFECANGLSFSLQIN